MATSLKINEDLKSRIQYLADVHNRSAHWLMIEAIRDYVEREEARQSCKQEALDSWKAYQETGRHLTGAETRTWLSTWGSADEQGIPPCHD